jgi:hypothetical protein
VVKGETLSEVTKKAENNAAAEKTV